MRRRRMGKSILGKGVGRKVEARGSFLIVS